MIFYPFSIKTNVAFFYVWFSLFALIRVIGQGLNNGRQNKTFELSSKFFHNGRLTDLASQIFEIFVDYEIAYRNTFELGNWIPGLSPDHIFTCYHNFCIMSLLSRQLSFPLQVKRRDSSFVTLMSFSAKLSLPARFFSHCFGSHSRTLNYFCNRLRTAKRYVTWLESNHNRSDHDHRIMRENPGVYIAMKSAVNLIRFILLSW